MVMTLRDVPETNMFSVYFLTRGDRVVDERPFVDVQVAQDHFDREIRKRTDRNDDGWVCLYNKKDRAIIASKRINPAVPELVSELNRRFGHRV